MRIKEWFMKKHFKFPYIFLLLIISTLTACDPTPSGNSGEAPKELSQFLLPSPKELTPFTLSTAGGETIGLKDLNGKWSFVFFGYTHCPDVCPTTLSLLGEVFEILEEQSTHTVQGIFVSVDPERDTPKSLKSYMAYYHPGIIGVTGDRNAIDSFTRQMMTSYIIHPPEVPSDPDSYLISHSSVIFIVDPQGHLVGVFPPPLKVKSIAADFQLLSTGVSKMDPSDETTKHF